MKKLFIWLYYFFASFGKTTLFKRLIPTEQEASIGAILTDRTEEKRAAYIAWSKPENIAKRLEEHEKNAAEALARGIAMREFLGVPPDEPLPPYEEIPEELRHQAPSTIKAFLRHKKLGMV